jgi:hypothetical protein
MTTTAAPADVTSDLAAALLVQGRERAAAAESRAKLVEALRQHFPVNIEQPDAKFDRALTLGVRQNDDAWAVHVSLAADYAYVLREDTSQLELIHAGSADLFGPEQTIMQVIADHGFQVLALADLQHGVESGDADVANIYHLCFQEGGDPFWEFNWFAGEA